MILAFSSVVQFSIQFDPTNSSAWIKYAELETQLEDFPRTRAIFELGVSQSQISMPELLWKSYIDFETEEGEREKGRGLYERLIGLSGHVKVWISYALFEAEAMPLPRSQREEEDEEAEEVPMVEGDIILARQVFQRGYNDLKSKGLKSEVRPFLPCSDAQQHVLILSCSESLYWKFGRPLKKRTDPPMIPRKSKPCSRSSVVNGTSTRNPDKSSKVSHASP